MVDLLRVLVIGPGKRINEKIIVNDHLAFCNIVGGAYKTIRLFSDVYIVVNNDAMLLDEPVTRVFADRFGTIVKEIRGTFFIVGIGDDKKMTSLSEYQINAYMGLFEEKVVYLS